MIAILTIGCPFIIIPTLANQNIHDNRVKFYVINQRLALNDAITYLSCLCIPDRRPGLKGVDGVLATLLADCMGVVTEGKVS
jgi:hypothetical protein